MTKPEVRFELTLSSFPDDAAVSKACEIIYQLNDSNLIAAMHVTPYQVGRSFGRSEQIRLSAELKDVRIGHRFKALAPHSEEIVFDPESAETSESGDPSPISSAPQSRPRWILWSSFSIAFVLLSSIALRWQLSESESSSTDLKPVVSSNQSSIEKTTENSASLVRAKLATKKGRVEVRMRDSLQWENAQLDEELSEGDSLRTYENASARILYPDGNFVVVRENSLLVIGRSGDSAGIQGLTREVELKDGRLRARLKTLSPEDSWLIRTQKGNLKISSRAAEPATEVSTQVTKSSLSFQLSEGSASFQPVDPKLEPIAIEKNQQIQAQDSEMPRVESFVPSIRLLYPRANETLPLKNNGENKFTFEWEAFRDGVEYEWKIYLDSQKRDLILSQKTSAEQVEVNYLDPGEIYWQVTCEIDGIEYSSSLERFYVEISNN
ncbi:MAG: hypothetical protein ACO3LE_07480 [Bdellovibrionota bacterium]